MAMYQQQILLNHLHKLNTENPINLTDFQQKAKENALKVGLYDNIKAIDATYNNIITQKIEHKLIDSIKL